MSGPLPQAHLDIVAQHAGFPDYATWQAWNAHRQAAITGGSNTVAQPQQQQPNFLMNILNQIPIHPSAILGYVNDRWNKATGQ